jgi:hypothetical protein
MPLRTQRRNTACLYRGIPRFGRLDRHQDGQALIPRPGSRLISGARPKNVSDLLTLALPPWTSSHLDCAA